MDDLENTQAEFIGTVQNITEALRGLGFNVDALTEAARQNLTQEELDAALDKELERKKKEHNEKWLARTQAATNAIGSFGSAVKGAPGSFAPLNKAVDLAAKGIGALVGKIPVLGGALQGLTEAAGQAMQFVMDSFNEAYSTFERISDTGVVVTFTDLKNAGESLNLTFADVEKVLAKNGKELAMLGGSAIAGRLEFERLGTESKEMRREFQRLGISASEFSEFQLGYVALQQRYNRGQTKDVRDLAEGSKVYIRELDSLSKLTGVSRKQLQTEQEARLRDVRYRAGIASLGETQRKEIDNFLGVLKQVAPDIEEGMKDLIASGGVPVTEAGKAAMLSLQQGGLNVQEVVRGLRTGAVKGFQAFDKVAGAAGKAANATEHLAKIQGDNTVLTKTFVSLRELEARRSKMSEKEYEKLKQQIISTSEATGDQNSNLADARTSMYNTSRMIEQLGTSVDFVTSGLKYMSMGVEFLTEKLYESTGKDLPEHLAARQKERAAIDEDAKARRKVADLEKEIAKDKEKYESGQMGFWGKRSYENKQADLQDSKFNQSKSERKISEATQKRVEAEKSAGVAQRPEDKKAVEEAKKPKEVVEADKAVKSASDEVARLQAINLDHKRQLRELQDKDKELKDEYGKADAARREEIDRERKGLKEKLENLTKEGSDAVKNEQKLEQARKDLQKANQNKTNAEIKANAEEARKKQADAEAEKKKEAPAKAAVPTPAPAPKPPEPTAAKPEAAKPAPAPVTAAPVATPAPEAAKPAPAPVTAAPVATPAPEAAKPAPKPPETTAAATEAAKPAPKPPVAAAPVAAPEAAKPAPKPPVAAAPAAAKPVPEAAKPAPKPPVAAAPAAAKPVPEAAKPAPKPPVAAAPAAAKPVPEAAKPVPKPPEPTAAKPETAKPSRIFSGTVTPASEAKPAKKVEMKEGISDQLVNFIKREEKFSPKAYWDKKQYSIGYGTKAKSEDEVIDKKEATARLKTALIDANSNVVSYARKKGYEFNQNEIDALTSFTYNAGSGNLYKLTANGNRTNEEIFNKLIEYNKAFDTKTQKMTELPGLTERRKREQEIFKGGINEEKDQPKTLSEKLKKITDILSFTSNSGSEQNFKELDSNLQNSVIAAAGDYFSLTNKKLVINSAKRDSEDQKRLYQETVKANRPGIGPTGMPVGKPGTSSHERGFAVDIQQGKTDDKAVAILNQQGLIQTVPKDPVHFAKVKEAEKPKARDGGILTGPKSGYDAELHGTEAVVPLPDGNNIPVKIEGFNLKQLSNALIDVTSVPTKIAREFTSDQGPIVKKIGDKVAVKIVTGLIPEFAKLSQLSSAVSTASKVNDVSNSDANIPNKFLEIAKLLNPTVRILSTIYDVAKPYFEDKKNTEGKTALVEPIQELTNKLKEISTGNISGLAIQPDLSNDMPENLYKPLLKQMVFDQINKATPAQSTFTPRQVNELDLAPDIVEKINDVVSVGYKQLTDSATNTNDKFDRMLEVFTDMKTQISEMVGVLESSRTIQRNLLSNSVN